MIMAGGEMCLLLPNRPLSFSDKMCQLRRRSTLPRCLFGPPDPAETEKLLQEQLQRERERFQRRFNIDLEALEAAVEKEAEKKSSRVKTEDVEDPRIPSLPAEVEDRLSSCSLGKGDHRKTARCDPGYGHPVLRKTGVCKKASSKFQKRVRAAGGHKRQTCLTEFWRARRSLAFVFGKSKARGVSLQSVTELLELEPPVKPTPALE